MSKQFPALCPQCKKPVVPVAAAALGDIVPFEAEPQIVYVESENRVTEARVVHVCSGKRGKKKEGLLHSHPGSGRTTSAKRPGEEAERSTSFLEPAPPRPQLIRRPPPGSTKP